MALVRDGGQKPLVATGAEAIPTPLTLERTSKESFLLQGFHVEEMKENYAEKTAVLLKEHP